MRAVRGVKTWIAVARPPAPAADLLPEAGLGVGHPLRLDLGPSAWFSASPISWESKEITS